MKQQLGELEGTFETLMESFMKKKEVNLQDLQLNFTIAESLLQSFQTKFPDDGNSQEINRYIKLIEFFNEIFNKFKRPPSNKNDIIELRKFTQQKHIEIFGFKYGGDQETIKPKEESKKSEELPN